MVRSSSRFTSAFVIVLLAQQAGLAQLPVAPPPHATLGDVVKEYLRLELPLPPKDAELVRIAVMMRHDGDDANRWSAHFLGFRLKPTRLGADSRYLIGIDALGPHWFDPYDVERADPTPDALAGIAGYGDRFLHLAVYCKLRGWNELAAQLYSRAWEHYSEFEERFDVIRDLRRNAFFMWERKLLERGSDRKQILLRLKQLTAEEKSLREPEAMELLGQLETTVNFTRKSKPGSVEALIDNLTEYRDTYEATDEAGHTAYGRLLEMGFDAVPALIEHLGDDRLSRAEPIHTFMSFRVFNKTVGHLCSEILFAVSANRIDGYQSANGGRVDPVKALEWFTTAKKNSEEKWLLDHVLPPDRNFGSYETRLARIIAVKYPSKLPAIYRDVLKKRESRSWCDFVDAIVISKLSREQKIAILEDGAVHDEFGHRIYALEGLAGIDRMTCRKHLLVMLKKVEASAAEGKHWLDIEPQVSDLGSLVERLNDADCWTALASTMKRVPYPFRMNMLSHIGSLNPPDQEDAIRRERLRFLMQFLFDRTAEARNESDEWDNVEVRDCAAAYLAGLLRFHVLRDDMFVRPDKKQGPLSRFAFRAIVAESVSCELATPKK